MGEADRHGPGEHGTGHSGAKSADTDATRTSPHGSPGDPSLGSPLATAVLGALFTAVPLGVYVLDPDLRLLQTGDRGPTPFHETPRPPLDWDTPHLGDSETVAVWLRRVLRTGEPVIERTLDPSPEQYRSLSLSAFRLAGDGGRPLGVAVSLRDTTERARAQARLELLHRGANEIGTTLDIFRTAQELAQTAVPALGGRAVVDVLESVVHGEAPAPGPVTDVTVRRAGFAATDMLSKSNQPVGAVRTMSFDTPFAHSLADLRPRLVRTLHPEDAWLRRDPARLRLLADSGAHSLLAVPMTARGVVLGIASFFRCHDERPFNEQDLAVATELVARAAVCVDNARLFTREHTLASLLQRSLVPPRLPHHSAVRTAHTYLPVAAGGTWYDVLPLSGSRVGLVVGEVAGQGLAAVAVMGRLRTAVSALGALDMAPDELLERMHELTMRLGAERAELAEDPVRGEPQEWPRWASDDGPSASGERYPLLACLLYAVYDPVTGVCTLASAGHPPPVLVTPDGEARTVSMPGGPLLGGHGEVRYPQTRIEVPAGSVLALYSQMLAEAAFAPGEPAAAVRAALDSAPTLQEACDAAVRTLVPSEPARDDVLLLLARTRVLGSDQVASWTLPREPESVAEARHLVTGQLTSWELEELVATTELMTSELVTNAVRYSSGPIELRLIRDHSLICEITDNSNASPHLRQAAEDDEGGRGLFLVAEFARDWGIRQTGRGKTVWAEQSLPGTEDTA
ncbi:SpoIIE family protein phosphatase [Streptomyces polyrhachis]|uniref:SpoIIE family protein phosphatase n=1 Tax=Streptomyces polyrhachis TaxID=1282885 RepID=A0ABW2GNS6_9ACTN